MKQKLTLLSIMLITTIALTILQGYWAMGKYADVRVYGLIGHMGTELFFFSLLLFFLIVLPLVLIGRRYNIHFSWQVSIITILIICYWFWGDFETFRSRVSSWSTFTLEEEWYHVKKLSLIPISVCSLLFALLFYIALRKTDKKPVRL